MSCLATEYEEDMEKAIEIELKNKINTIKEVCFDLIYKTIDIEKKILSDRKKNREIFYLLEELLDKSADLNWYFHELEDFIAEKFEELKKDKNQKHHKNF